MEDSSKLVCVFQANEFTWLCRYARFSYRNAIRFREAIEMDVSNFRKVLHGYQMILEYRIFGMKTILGELFLVRIVTESLTPEEQRISFLVDGLICLYIGVCWIVSVYIIKSEYFGVGFLKKAFSTSGIFRQICNGYWNKDAKIYGKSLGAGSYFTIIQTEKLKNFFAIAQLGVLGICCLAIFGDHFVRIARYLN